MTLSSSLEDRAAAGWIIADEIMKERTGGRPRSYGKRREATLNGVKLTGKDHVLVEHFAKPVFEAAAAKKKGNHGLAGYVGDLQGLDTAQHQEGDLPGHALLGRQTAR